MLTSAEVCEQLRISEKTLRRMIADGEIAALKVGGGRWGGTYRISEDALAEFIQRQTVKVQA